MTEGNGNGKGASPEKGTSGESSGPTLITGH